MLDCVGDFAQSQLAQGGQVLARKETAQGVFHFFRRIDFALAKTLL
jgi:hypothetical protein